MVNSDKNSNNNSFFFSLQEINNWQINSGNLAGPASDSTSESPRVELPILQRGFVWKSLQVENFWDSLIREFPVGAFLLAKISADKKSQSPSESQEGYFLVDGQQRATAIGLGFSSLWRVENCPEQSSNVNQNNQNFTQNYALWLDLSTYKLSPPDIALKFRLLTRSHPWGYGRANNTRLQSYQRDAALFAYTEALKKYNKDTLYQYPDIPLRYVWPWDAYLPIPFSILSDIVINPEKDILNSDFDNELILEKFKEKIDGVEFWNQDIPMKTGLNDKCWKAQLFEILNNVSDENKLLGVIVSQLVNIHKNYKISAVCLPENDPADEIRRYSFKDSSLEPFPDLLESNFVRANTAATRLEGEELAYSIFKSFLPKSKKLVESIGKDAHVRPSRLVALTARLIMAEEKTGSNENFPGPLNVARFREKLYASGEQPGSFKDNLHEFIEQHCKDNVIIKDSVFGRASRLLLGEKFTEAGEGSKLLGLGRILTADLAQNSQDLYLLLLRSIRSEKLTEADLKDDSTRKRILGLLTALAWFSNDSSEMARRLWGLENWWAGEASKPGLFGDEVMGLKKDSKLIMYPLPSPKLLKEVLKSLKLYSLTADDLIDGSDWQWAQRKQIISNCPESLSTGEKLNIFNGFPKFTGDNEDSGDPEIARLKNECWWSFWGTVSRSRVLVLFAQRDFLEEKFPNYEPEAPDQLEDTDRPYDWDHILPSNYCDQKLTRGLWKYWARSNGNFRAWPQADNRGDSDALPAKKLTGKDEEETKRILKNSAIITQNNRDNWLKITDENSGDLYQALKDTKNLPGAIGNIILSSITDRLFDVYATWYDCLELKDTFGAKNPR
ncbi:MAG: DUF262 domain-containing protein [Deltaproteobacteria bacterium]|jgi:hypothetical protein|nr:DUF262 domain-containing protein [Deltaproteobacteria bacterium]